jgi:S-adenosylmethionine-diacylglycerol 3-amino-3-carboxypropyl transferase
MYLRDALYARVFVAVPVYDILYEDSEVDGVVLDVDGDSDVLSIGAAGCGVAGLARFRPRSIDVVDINPHHLALAALKLQAVTDLEDHGALIDLFARPRPSSMDRVATLARRLPDPIAAYWSSSRRRSLLTHGLTARMLGILRAASFVDESWLRAQAVATPEQRQFAVEDRILPVLRNPVVSRLLTSPLQLLALGINFQQRDRLVAAQGALLQFIEDHLRRLAGTDLTTNWFAWYAVTGGYDVTTPDAMPPFLRADSHARSLGWSGARRFTHGSILTTLERARPGQYSHVTLCDAPDWMSDAQQETLLQGIRRSTRPGATVLVRSVEAEPWVERHAAGRALQWDQEASTWATRHDRSRQYNRVDVYRRAASS